MTDDDFMSRIDPDSRWDNPETRWGDPEKDLPNVPSVRVPTVGNETEETDEFSADVDPEQMRLFWGSVVLANIGVAGVALGAMLVYFRSQWLIGGGAFVFGVFALWRVYAMYSEHKSRDWASEHENEDDASETDADDVEASDAGASDDTERNP